MIFLSTVGGETEIDWDSLDRPYWTARCANCGGTRGFDHLHPDARCATILNDTKTITFTVFTERA